MKDYQRIAVSFVGKVATIELNRPELHNAFDDVLLTELRAAVASIADNPQIRVLVVSGRGKSFCAGADLNWMRRMKDFDYDKNYEDAYQLSQMLYELYNLPIPTIAKVDGAAIGGGVGLVAACDIVVATTNTIFALSEVRLGLVPACISPYLLKRINNGALKEYFLTGIRFPAEHAKAIGLVNEVVEEEQLEEAVERIGRQVCSCGPKALQAAKELIDRVPHMSAKEWMDYTAQVIAKLRVSEEGQEGLNAFLEKRKPAWVKKG